MRVEWVVPRGPKVFEQLDSEDEKDEKDKVSVGESVGVYFLILGVAFVSLLAFIILGNKPHGFQIASLISYSCVVFVYTFFRTRGINTRHSLEDEYVQRCLPRLLVIHCIYLAAVYFIVDGALSIRPSMSAWWLTYSGNKGMPPFDFALFLGIGVIAISQVVLSRTILSRSKKELSSDETAERQ
jgi:hypothetical protein